MKILVCDPVSPKGIALLQQRPEFQVVVLPKRLSEAELLPLVADAPVQTRLAAEASEYVAMAMRAGKSTRQAF